MIVKEEFLSRLRKIFDLNLYEVKVWTALLSRGVSTAGELSNISDVPRSRTYDILESLEKKGFIVMKLGKPLNYVAVEPGEVVERAKKLVNRDAKEQVKKLEEQMKNYPHPERLAECPSYIELAPNLEMEQESALRLMALGKTLGIWDVVNAKTLGMDDATASQMAGQGFLMISGYKLSK